MANLQEVFNHCKELYNDAYTLVQNMATVVAGAMKEQGKSFDPSVTTGKFDIVLQYSLLQVAAADYDLDSNEIIFIRDITKQGDFIDFLNEVCEANETWESIYNSDVSALNKFLGGIAGPMAHMCEEIIDVFVLCDGATDFDYFTPFANVIIDIIRGVTAMDGYVSDSEERVPVLIIAMLNKIKEQLGK